MTPDDHHQPVGLPLWAALCIAAAATILWLWLEASAAGVRP